MTIFPTVNAESYTDRPETSAEKKSYVFDFKKGEFVTRDGKNVIVTGNERIKVWIEKLIRTELGRYQIYEGTTYGVRFPTSVIGLRDRDYIRDAISSELRAKLTENEEITSVREITVNFERAAVYVSAAVITVYDGEEITVEYYR